jgi:hypothetical protein
MSIQSISPIFLIPSLTLFADDGNSEGFQNAGVVLQIDTLIVTNILPQKKSIFENLCGTLLVIIYKRSLVVCTQALVHYDCMQ